jgi:hypothetical protein
MDNNELVYTFSVILDRLTLLRLGHTEDVHDSKLIIPHFSVVLECSDLMHTSCSGVAVNQDALVGFPDVTQQGLVKKNVHS